MDGDTFWQWTTRSGIAGLGLAWLASFATTCWLLLQLSQCDGSAPHGPPTCGMVWGAFFAISLGVIAGIEGILLLWGWLGFERPSWRQVVAAVLAPVVVLTIYELAFDSFAGLPLWKETPLTRVVSWGAVLWGHGLAVGWGLVEMIREAFGLAGSEDDERGNNIGASTCSTWGERERPRCEWLTLRSEQPETCESSASTPSSTS